MSIKRYLARLAEKITGRKCCRCKHNCGGQCTHPSDGMFMRCWHGITRPGFSKRNEELERAGRWIKEGFIKGVESAPGDMTQEEKYQLAQIVANLQEASATARDGGLLED